MKVNLVGPSWPREECCNEGLLHQQGSESWIYAVKIIISTMNIDLRPN